jgi:lipopolysaccharide cholinephosphotransferase
VEQNARRLAEDDIGRVQDVLMKILLELDAVTRTAGLSYFLAYGTAIGALRHHDFIPWDFDADVLVWRDEYEPLVEALRANLPDDVTLFTPTDDPGYEYLFARLGVRGIDHTRVHVDLFPLERAPSRRSVQRVYSRVAKLCCQIYIVKQMAPASRPYYSRAKRLATRVGKGVLAPVPARVLRRFFFAFTRWFAERSNGDVVVSSCGSYGLREFFRRSWFDTAEPVRFRDHQLKVPSGSKELLEYIYGDYMTPVSDSVRDSEVAFFEDHCVGPLRSHGIV